MKVNETIKEIRKCCRLAMNGVVSTNMREQGLTYKLNFGVSLMQIKDIAKRFSADKELAERLWVEDVRELKILATLLYPVEEFSEESSNIWVTQIPNQEIREQVCANLFPKLPFSDKLVKSWVMSESEDIRTTGYWLLTRLLLLKNEEINTDLELYPHILGDVISDNLTLRNSTLLALKNMGRTNRTVADGILKRLQTYKNSEDILKREIYESLKFEFDFYLE